jgi:hypothetical protein
MPAVVMEREPFDGDWADLCTGLGVRLVQGDLDGR